MNNPAMLDKCPNLKAAESASTYEGRIDYVNAYGSKPFGRSVLEGGNRLYNPNPATVMNEFRRVWRERH